MYCYDCLYSINKIYSFSFRPFLAYWWHLARIVSRVARETGITPPIHRTCASRVGYAVRRGCACVCLRVFQPGIFYSNWLFKLWIAGNLELFRNPNPPFKCSDRFGRQLTFTKVNVCRTLSMHKYQSILQARPCHPLFLLVNFRSFANSTICPYQNPQPNTRKHRKHPCSGLITNFANFSRNIFITARTPWYRASTYWILDNDIYLSNWFKFRRFILTTLSTLLGSSYYYLKFIFFFFFFFFFIVSLFFLLEPYTNN